MAGPRCGPRLMDRGTSLSGFPGYGPHRTIRQRVWTTDEGLSPLDETGNSAPPLVLSGIGRRFRQRWALRGASLRIERGEVVALMGRNGTGKSTLLRVV